MSTKKTGTSLANRIRAATTQSPVQELLRTDEKVLERITEGIYRQPSSALRELISNAYDADATEVIIQTDAPRFSIISIRDNGNGLSPEILDHLIQHIGGSPKRTSEGVDLEISAKDDPNCSPGGRQLIGKLGIGLFSVAQFTRHFLVITKTRGENYRTIADITLGTDDLNVDQIFTTGHALIWRERTSDKESHGTEIKLLKLLPRTRAELASLDLWAKSDIDKEEEGKLFSSEPIYHIGRMDPELPDSFKTDPHLPWKETDKPRARFESFVTAIHKLSSTEKDRINLEQVCDRYLQTLWTLALASPLDYLDSHPFDLSAKCGFHFFEIENLVRGQAKPIKLKQNDTLRKSQDLQTPCLRKGDKFAVFVDGVQLFRPIVFHDQSMQRNPEDIPLLCVSQCREEFDGKLRSLSGGPLEFEGYLLWSRKVLPTQHQGVMIRVGNASGSLFDPTFMGYQISEQTRLRQITAEIFVREGLDGAINLDRESFNYAHPHYQFIVKWLHSSLRQLTNRHKDIGAENRKQRLATQSKKARQKLDELVEKLLQEQGIEDVPDVVLLNTDDESKAPDLRDKGIVALRKSLAIPKSNARRRTSLNKEQLAFLEKKAIAIAQILHAWGLLESLTFQNQEKLVRDILEIALSEVE